jgi:7-cyano-7-deazaguanine synthase
MKAVVLLSGGIDSSTLLYSLHASEYDCRALIVNYNQRHSKELSHAVAIAERLNVPYTMALLDPKLFAGSDSSQTNPDVAVPEGHYEDASMRSTVVANRNMLLLAMAGAVAEATKANAVAYAAHAGDHAIYPDCRPEFAIALAEALRLGTYQKVELIRPFISMTKAEIVRLGAELGVPFELTYSCYQGRIHHCGVCGTCVERREAFSLANVIDPTVYRVPTPN